MVCQDYFDPEANNNPHQRSLSATFIDHRNLNSVHKQYKLTVAREVVDYREW